MLRLICHWLAVFACLSFCGLGLSRASAQPADHSLFLPQIQQAAFQLKGEIWDVMSSPIEPLLVVASFNPVGHDLGEIPDFLVISQNGGVKWERTAAGPWERTGLGAAARTAYGLIERASSVSLVALVYGYTPDQSQIVDLYISDDLGANWARNSLSIPEICANQYIRAELLNRRVRLGTGLYVRMYCLVPMPGDAPHAISYTVVSHDLGQSWSVLPNQPSEEAFVVPSPATDAALFLLGSGSQISRSSDGGQTWTLIGTSPPGSLSLSEVNPDRIAIVSSSPGQLSLDAGFSWREWQNLDCPSARTGTSYVEVMDNGVVGYVMCSDGNIHASHDDWLTWTRVAAIAPRRAGNFGLVVDHSMPNSLFVLEYGVGGGLWRLDTSTGVPVQLLDTISPFTP